MKHFIHLLLLLGLVCFQAPAARAQLSSSETKQLEKAQKLKEESKYDDAEKILRKLANGHPEVGKVWNELCEVQYHHYLQLKETDKVFGNMKITVKGADGVEKDGASDSLASQLMSIMDEIKPSKKKYKEFINTCREATLKNRYAYLGAIYLRNIFVDAPVDTAVDSKAYLQFSRAEKEFGKQNYSKAAEYYQKALEIDSNYYKARLYLGDCYYAMQDYKTAAEYFRYALRARPDLLEPRKYLADALSGLGATEEAIQEVIAAISLYPDPIMILKLGDLAESNGMTYKVGHVIREVFPAGAAQTLVDTMGGKREKLTEGLSDEWKTYLEAYESVKQYYDSKGILKQSNSLTSQRYLEVYCWEQLLKKADPENYPTARKMQEKGYLDCYVLVSLYHYDLYGQFSDLSKNQRLRIEKYLYSLLAKN